MVLGQLFSIETAKRPTNSPVPSPIVGGFRRARDCLDRAARILASGERRLSRGPIGWNARERVSHVLAGGRTLATGEGCCRAREGRHQERVAVRGGDDEGVGSCLDVAIGPRSGLLGHAPRIADILSKLGRFEAWSIRSASSRISCGRGTLAARYWAE